jgi:hypothetical protein
MAYAVKTQVLTANRLADGHVVYLAEDGWTSDLDKARLLSDEGMAESAEQEGREAVAARLVVEPYLIDVEAEAAEVQAVRLRERIRAEGPTTGNSRAAA